MKFLYVICVILLTFTITCDAAKIVAFFLTPGKSHLILGAALLEGLLEKGHEVTLVSSLPHTIKHDNFTNLYVKTTMRDMQTFFASFTPSQPKDTKPKDILQMRDEVSQLTLVGFLPLIGNVLARSITTDAHVLSTLYASKFDLVIVINFQMDALLGFGRYYNAPVITFETVAPTHLTNRLTGNHNPYSWIPEKWLPYTEKMTFLERAHNFLFGTVIDLYFAYQNHLQQKLYAELFPNATATFEQVMTEVSLVLTNSQPSLSFARPLAPNIIEIGGFHVKPARNIGGDLGGVLDAAQAGVIYFSLGSNVNSSSLPMTLKRDILDVFGRLKQTVLWKFEDETMRDIPGNVHVGKWFAQADILAHPNVRLFITHGGLLSQTESIDRGVPLLGIPLFSDQFLNMKRAETLGFGLTLTFENLTQSSLSWAIEEMLTNKRYSLSAKYYSQLIHDQAVKPLDRAIYWIEYVMRHKGAKHLQMASVHLSWYERYSLDVLAFIFTILSLVVYTAIYFTRITLRLFKRKLKLE